MRINKSTIISENMSLDFRFYSEYLHKRDVEPIFDVLKWKYFHAKRVLSWDFNDFKLTLKVETEPKDKEIIVEVFPLDERVFIVRAGLGHLPKFRAKPLLIKEKLEEIKPVFKKLNNELTLSTKKVTCVIRLDKWHMKMTNEKGEVFFEEYLNGILRGFFPVFPLCYKLIHGEVHFIESISLSPSEAIYGLGERFGRLNKRGQRLFMWNSDTTMTSSDRSYKSIPFYLSSKGYGLFVNSSAKMVFEIGSEYCYNALSFEVWQGYLEYIIFYGPSLKDILSMYVELTGKPPLPPLWSFGLWMSRCMYKNRKEVEEVARKLRTHGIPCDVIHIDPMWLRLGHYCDLEWNLENFPHPREMLEKLKRMGFRVSLWIQPYIPKDTKMYEEGAKKGYFIKRKNGTVYNIVDFVHKEVGIVDFTNPKAKEWYKRKLKRLHEMGVSVFKCDMGEAIPEDAVFYNGRTGIEMHNLYPLLYQGTVFEASKEFFGTGLVWGRSGCAGIQRYPVQWSGDSHCTFEDMACVLRGGLSYSLSGVPFWSHDIGGFQGPKPSPKLYIRWSQWGLLSSHSRCHGTTPREPWEYGDEALKVFREFTRLRYSLLPYLYSCAYESSRTGLPVVRPLVLEYQEDPTVRELDTEYLLGPFLLVVPVLNGNDEVEYYIPKGMWLDWWTRKPIEGGLWRKDRVPIDKIPLFIRENALIPRVKPLNYIGEKLYKRIKAEVFLKDKASLNYLFDNEKFLIETTREEDVVIISLGPSNKSWLIELYDEDKPKDVVCEGCKLKSYSYEIELRKVTVEINNIKERAKVKVFF